MLRQAVNTKEDRVFVTSPVQYIVQHILRCRVPRTSSSSHGVDKLVDESARHVGLPDDAFLVVLADGATQFVIVHGGPVLPDAPQSGHVSRIFNFENAFGGWDKQKLVLT